MNQITAHRKDIRYTEGAGAIKCCGMMQACNLGVVPLSYLEKTGLENNGESVIYSVLIYQPNKNDLMIFLLLESRLASMYVN